MQVCYGLESGLTAHHWLNRCGLTATKCSSVHGYLHLFIVRYERPEMCSWVLRHVLPGHWPKIEYGMVLKVRTGMALGLRWIEHGMVLKVRTGMALGPRRISCHWPQWP